METFSVLILVLLWTPASLRAEDLGNLSANPFDADSTATPSAKAAPLRRTASTIPSALSAAPLATSRRPTPFATDAPRIYDQQGNYRGKLSANPFDPDSTGNRFGRYGSLFSPHSLNNQFGAGNPFRPDQPKKLYGREWRIEGGR